MRRVNREIKILKKARHGNIIQLYEVLDTKNTIYLIMECAEGYVYLLNSIGFIFLSVNSLNSYVTGVKCSILLLHKSAWKRGKHASFSIKLSTALKLFTAMRSPTET